MVSKKIKRRNRITAWILAIITSYVLLVNNSLEFLNNLGLSLRPEVVNVFMILLTISFVGWKAGGGEL